MSIYTAQIDWTLRDGDDFAARRYSRVHTITFDGGAELAGSPSPSIVRAPHSDSAGVDPEEMFVASLSACHMLFVLEFAARAGWTVERYRDAAEGVLAKDVEGRLAMTRVTLRPEIRFQSPEPSTAALSDLHHRAHAACFIANSVRTEVVVAPQLP